MSFPGIYRCGRLLIVRELPESKLIGGEESAAFPHAVGVSNKPVIPQNLNPSQRPSSRSKAVRVVPGSLQLVIPNSLTNK